MHNPATRLTTFPRRFLPLLVTLTCLLIGSGISTSNARDEPALADSAGYVPKVVARAEDGSWSVESLGRGVYLFRWWPGFYVSTFVVGRDAVLVVDPVSREVAALYETAVSMVTDKPIEKIVYSHDHRDHIVGADVLAPGAEIYAHPGTAASLVSRGDSDIPVPTQLVINGDQIAIPPYQVKVHYFGPNHGRSNIALEFDTGLGSMLAFVDTLEIGIAPYRYLPDTNVHGYIESLKAAAELRVDWVLGGHSGPGPGRWIRHYLNYFQDMVIALTEAGKVVPAPTADSVGEVIAQGERHRDAIIGRAVDDLRPTYGEWHGFDAWAPMNAQTVMTYLITGN